ncbi:aminodeoxychorismate synthase component I [Aetokthonos hydrillicola Thurmond2011]|jgi:para-aminobenzoate synthetase|uniref:aminodeoxychorismate synthase n=1 Tax=Aetokthonos hydrillicola Thurmond2011 TaxID=2712845 RepID=A0AAP5MBU3_9CYAN|nr:aminodeoxychorismate synthase component I [Aetokthonos hydrillicola]MBO3460249.1 aminodeoxychorismate synthase component I [Aetokthonos hydrillicola CCALA 1050]MBW4586982.1 aminodeoxychorismate synthase component I [Aetokthonos hydrillicola CCALA 1050]MDR9897543.1 aminodeoxychorismate synthase component I [Aetokthonos hydrillicola Thurmond2011]
MKTLIIDNYDSYTFNLYQLIAEVNGGYPTVIYNDQFAWKELQQWEFDNIVISPGPGRPENLKDFGICRQAIEKTQVPLLGVCLGHQGIGNEFGGKVIHAPEVRHGRLSQVYHTGTDLFAGIPSPFSVVRYHSLVVADDLPDCLEKVAWTEDNLIMGIRHRSLPLWGVQFHPESICTQYGHTLFENFKQITLKFTQERSKTPKKQYWTGSSQIAPLPTSSSWQKQQQKFKLSTCKLDICPDTEQMFVHLFGKSPNAFWLDSSRVEPDLARFSFMGDSSGENSLLIRYQTKSQELTVTNSHKITRRKEGIFEYLKRELEWRRCSSDDLPFDFNCGFVGYFGYELKAECGSQLNHPSSLPDAMFLLADRMIAIDHQEQTLYLLCLTQEGQKASAEAWFELLRHEIYHLPPLSPVVVEKKETPVIFQLSRCERTYIKDIKKCLEEIHEGETYQVCLTNQIHTDATPDPLEFYRSLRQINPAPYSAFLRFGDVAIASSSPERFLRIDRQGWVETKPIKGTLPRGKTPDEDFILREKLRNSEKDRAENLMIVDLLRNDLGRVCAVGTVHVPKLMDVESYATVHQLVTTIRGQLRSNMTAIDCIRNAFPGGSMTGAPKLRTMEIIDRLEQEARGVYSGAIGFLGLNGSADLNIVIRTAVLTTEQTSIGVGGGIVALSDPQMEFEEIMLKAKALIHAMLMTTQGEFDPSQNYIQGTEVEVVDSSEKVSV